MDDIEAKKPISKIVVITIATLFLASVAYLAYGYFTEEDTNTDQSSVVNQDGLSVEAGGQPENDIGSNSIGSGRYNYETYSIEFDIPEGWTGMRFQTANGVDGVNVYSPDYQESEDTLAGPKSGAEFYVSCNLIVDASENGPGTVRVASILADDIDGTVEYNDLKEVMVASKTAAQFVTAGNGNFEMLVTLFETSKHSCSVSHVDTGSQDFSKYLPDYEKFINSISIL